MPLPLFSPLGFANYDFFKSFQQNAVFDITSVATHTYATPSSLEHKMLSQYFNCVFEVRIQRLL